jgi:mono/diheme cytochrome c family protein
MMVDATTFHPTTREHLTLSGNTPLGMVVSPDGRKAYVSYENSLYLSVLDLSAYADPSALPEPSFVPYEYRDVPELVGGQNGIGTQRLVRHLSETPLRPTINESAQIVLLDEDPMDPVMRRGRILFTSSNVEKYPELTAVTMTSCASCHVAGGTDGSMWATMEGERKTMGLWGGTRNRGWLHISATHRDIQSFADLVVRERLGGQLSSSDQDALSRYVADGIPTLQSPHVDEALAAEGEVLFAAHCASCHFGERQTSGLPDPADPLGGGRMSGPILYDIGTATDDARVALAPFLETLLPEQEAEILRLCRGDRELGEGDPLQELLDFRQRPTRLRGEFKAPDLTNVWDHTLFLHDGRFDRLEDVVHFFVETLELPIDESGERAIVEYLKTL